jgi:hypothetical protein
MDGMRIRAQHCPTQEFVATDHTAYRLLCDVFWGNLLNPLGVAYLIYIYRGTKYMYRYNTREAIQSLTQMTDAAAAVGLLGNDGGSR